MLSLPSSRTRKNAHLNAHRSVAVSVPLSTGPTPSVTLPVTPISPGMDRTGAGGQTYLFSSTLDCRSANLNPCGMVIQPCGEDGSKSNEGRNSPRFAVFRLLRSVCGRDFRDGQYQPRQRRSLGGVHFFLANTRGVPILISSVSSFLSEFHLHPPARRAIATSLPL